MSERTLTIQGVAVPRFLYGTAWKEDTTQSLTEQALRAGFRGIDRRGVLKRRRGCAPER